MFGAWFHRPGGRIEEDLNTVLAHCAAATGRTSCLRNYGGDLTLLIGEGGASIMRTAALHGSDETPIFLLSKGLKADAKDKDGNTPPLVARRATHQECVDLLQKARGAEKSIAELSIGIIVSPCRRE